MPASLEKQRKPRSARNHPCCALELLSSMHQRCSYPTVMASHYTPQPTALEGRRSAPAKGCSSDGYLHLYCQPLGELTPLRLRHLDRECLVALPLAARCNLTDAGLAAPIFGRRHAQGGQKEAVPRADTGLGRRRPDNNARLGRISLQPENGFPGSGECRFSRFTPEACSQPYSRRNQLSIV